MSDTTRAVVEVKWLLAAFPEAELRNEVIYFNGSAFPVTLLTDKYDEQKWSADSYGWADDVG